MRAVSREGASTVIGATDGEGTPIAFGANATVTSLVDAPADCKVRLAR